MPLIIRRNFTMKELPHESGLRRRSLFKPKPLPPLLAKTRRPLKIKAHLGGKITNRRRKPKSTFRVNIKRDMATQNSFLKRQRNRRNGFREISSTISHNTIDRLIHEIRIDLCTKM